MKNLYLKVEKYKFDNEKLNLSDFIISKMKFKLTKKRLNLFRIKKH